MVGIAMVGIAMVGIAIVGMVGIAMVGIAMVGIAMVGIAMVGIAMVGRAMVGIAMVGIAMVGIAMVGIAMVGIAGLWWSPPCLCGCTSRHTPHSSQLLAHLSRMNATLRPHSPSIAHAAHCASVSAHVLECGAVVLALAA
jgi:hypothetical protein